MSRGINFIKSIGQLITGGIGVIGDSLYFKDSQGNVKSASDAPVLSELPEADPSKAGQQFWLNGTLWTYAKDGQFGALAEGEPFPVKGYKETVLSVTSIIDAETRTASILASDSGAEIQDGTNPISFILLNIGDNATLFNILVEDANEDRPHALQGIINANGDYEVATTFDQSRTVTELASATTLFIREYPPTS